MDIHIQIYIYIYRFTYIHKYTVYTCIYTCTHSSQPPKERDVEITKLPGTFDILLGVFALRSDGTRRSVGDMIGTAEAAVTGSQQGSYPESRHSMPAFVENAGEPFG